MSNDYSAGLEWDLRKKQDKLIDRIFELLACGSN